MGRLENSPALPSAVSTTHSGTAASSSSYGRDTAVAPSEGRSFIDAIPSQPAYLEEEPTVPLYTWLDPQRTTYSFGCSSPPSGARFFHVSGRGRLPRRLVLRKESAAGRLGGCHHRPSGVGVIFTIKCSSWAEPYINPNPHWRDHQWSSLL